MNFEFSSYYANVRLLGGDLQHDQKCFLRFSQKLFRILTCDFLHVVDTKLHIFSDIVHQITCDNELMAADFLEKSGYHKNSSHIETVPAIAFSMKNSKS